MVFYLIGLGLSSPEDISLRGLKAVKGAKRVYLEMYTAVLMAQKEEIEQVYERKVILADRDMVESQGRFYFELCEKVKKGRFFNLKDKNLENSQTLC